MIYLIYGNQTPSIKKQMNKIISANLPESDEMNLVRFDATTVLVQEAMEEALYLPLGYNHKIVIMENCYFLESKKQKNKIDSDQDFKPLIDYINHPNEECDVILTVHTSAVDEKNDP